MKSSGNNANDTVSDGTREYTNEIIGGLTEPIKKERKD